MKIRVQVVCDRCAREAPATLEIDDTGTRPHVDDVMLPANMVRLQSGDVLCLTCANEDIRIRAMRSA